MRLKRRWPPPSGPAARQRLNPDDQEPFMRTTLFDNGDFAYFADLTPVPDPVGGHCLTISSRLVSSRASQAEQVRFRACLADEQQLAGGHHD